MNIIVLYFTLLMEYRLPDNSVCNENYFSYFSIKAYVVGTQKNCLNVVGTQKIHHKKCIVSTFHDS